MARSISFTVKVGALLVLIVAAISAVAIALPWPGPAAAAGLTVNTTNDELNSDGDCSLREAIQAANTDTAVDACTAGSGADIITVPAGTYTLSIAGANEDANATGDLDITADLTINGAGATTTIIDGAALDRVFHVLAGNTVEISGVTIQNGSGSGEGGGISNSGTTTLTNSAVTGNSAAANAGGIMNQSSGALLTLIDSTVSGNSANGSGGGIHTRGTFISGNWVGGTVTLINSTVSGNTITGNAGGGGIANLAGTLTLTNSTVSGNTTAAQGGGIYNWGVDGTTSLENSTVSGNSAATHGGGIVHESGTVNFKNTIVAGNSHGGGGSPNECTGTLTSQGYNLVQNVSGCTITGDLTGNITGQDPLLGPLQNNGGPTETHALLTGSPAIDAGNPATPGSGGNACEATDQRGVARPAGSACDIGAFEGSVPAPTPTPTPTPGDTDGDGCPDVRENGLDETLGGQRDPLNPWDWYDVNGDGVIDLLFDILGVIQHYQPTAGGAPPYDVVFDRGPTTGPNAWNMTAPDGVIDLLNDILGVINQFGHRCQ